MKITLKRPKAILVHPNHPEVRFRVMKPTAAEALEFRDSTAEYDRREVAIHPQTGEVLRRADGSPEFLEVPPVYPMSLMTDYLGKYVENIEGLEDEDGSRIAYRTDSKESVLKLLLDPAFHVHEPRPTNPERCDECGMKADHAVHGKNQRGGHKFREEEGEKENVTACTQWLVVKISDPKTYVPLAETSSSEHSNLDSGSGANTAETAA